MLTGNRNNALIINADLGEGSPFEDKLYPLLDAASIACGGHAGDKTSMEFAVSQCLTHQVMIGAHPSYPDPQHFGRRSLSIEPKTLTHSLLQQLCALEKVCRKFGAVIEYIKPHGALYHDLSTHPSVFDAFVDAVKQFTESDAPALMLMAGSKGATKAKALGYPVMEEAFLDRRYQSATALCQRSLPGALLTHTQALTQYEQLRIDGTITLLDKNTVPLICDTLCVHGDNPDSLTLLTELTRRQTL